MRERAAGEHLRQHLQQALLNRRQQRRRVARQVGERGAERRREAGGEHVREQLAARRDLGPDGARQHADARQRLGGARRRRLALDGDARLDHRQNVVEVRQNRLLHRDRNLADRDERRRAVGVLAREQMRMHRVQVAVNEDVGAVLGEARQNGDGGALDQLVRRVPCT
jgi:hypothetical protein